MTVNPLDGSGATPIGAITAIEIDADTGDGIPTSTTTNVYQLCAYISGSIDSGNASVVSLEGGVSNSQCVQRCGGGMLFGTV